METGLDALVNNVAGGVDAVVRQCRDVDQSLRRRVTDSGSQRRTTAQQLRVRRPVWPS